MYRPEAPRLVEIRIIFFATQRGRSIYDTND